MYDYDGHEGATRDIFVDGSLTDLSYVIDLDSRMQHVFSCHLRLLLLEHPCGLSGEKAANHHPHLESPKGIRKLIHTELPGSIYVGKQTENLLNLL
jgi:hypothetical protein